MTENKTTVQYDTDLWNEFQTVQAEVIIARAKSKKWTIASIMCFTMTPVVVLLTSGNPLISIPVFFLGWSCLAVSVLSRRKIEKKYKCLVDELNSNEKITSQNIRN